MSHAPKPTQSVPPLYPPHPNRPSSDPQMLPPTTRQSNFNHDQAAIAAAQKIHLMAANGRPQSFPGGYDIQTMQPHHLNSQPIVTPVHFNSTNETYYGLEHPEADAPKRKGILWKINNKIQELTGIGLKLGEKVKLISGLTRSNNRPSQETTLDRPSSRGSHR